MNTNRLPIIYSIPLEEAFVFVICDLVLFIVLRMQKYIILKTIDEKISIKFKLRLFAFS